MLHATVAGRSWFPPGLTVFDQPNALQNDKTRTFVAQTKMTVIAVQSESGPWRYRSESSLL